jgi:hypothetical protein
MATGLLSRADFDGNIFPNDITRQIVNAGLSGAPFFDALTRRQTNRSQVVFGTAAPTGFAWTGELQDLPDLDANSDSVVIAPAKIGGLLLMSNESLRDAEVNLTGELGRVVAESLAPAVDAGCLYGEELNAAAPVGIVGALDAVDGATLRAAMIAAAGEMMRAGGVPNTAFVSPELWAAEAARRESTSAGSGVLDDLGIPLTTIVVPSLQATDALLVDTRQAFGVVSVDAEIKMSADSDTAMKKDGVLLRITARVNAVIPVPDKAARAITVTAPEPEGS